MNRNPNWQANFLHSVTVKCKNEFCNNYIHTITAAIHQGVYCAECKREAHRIADRNYYERKKRRIDASRPHPANP